MVRRATLAARNPLPALRFAHVQTDSRHPRRPFRCRGKGCRKFCSAQTGTVLEGAQVGYQNWLLAAFLVLTSLQGVSSMKLHRGLGVTRKTAWCLAQRVRQALRRGEAPCAGPVEGDETSVGGKRKNRPQAQRERLTGRGAVGQVAVVGVKDRASRKVAARVASSPGQGALPGFVEDCAAPGATVSTDDASACESLRFDHGTVRRSLQEYVRGDVHTNGIESLWSMLQRACQGTFHKLSPKHLERYVQECAAMRPPHGGIPRRRRPRRAAPVASAQRGSRAGGEPTAARLAGSPRNRARRAPMPSPAQPGQGSSQTPQAQVGALAEGRGQGDLQKHR